MGLMLALLLSLQDPKLSGPQPGEKTPGFKVFDVGSRQETDYVTEGKGAPSVLVFIHELSRPGAALMRKLDDYGRLKAARGLRTHFISLSEDRDGAERHLPQVIKSLNLKCPMGISLDGKEGPGAYGLNREVMLTILVSRDNKVSASFAIVSPNETDAPKIKEVIDADLAAAAAAVPGTPEERRLREELAVAREEIVALKMKLEKQGDGTPRREMGSVKEDEALVNQCRRLIQRQATQDDLNAAVKDIEAYIANNDALRTQYVAILGRILDLKYGNDLGQAEMRRQLEKHQK